LSHLQRPGDAEAGTERSDRYLTDVVAGQLQGTLAANPGLSVPSTGSGQAWEKGVKRYSFSKTPRKSRALSMDSKPQKFW